MLTSELLTAGGAVGLLVAADYPIAGLGCLIVWTESGRKHGLLALSPALPLPWGQGLGEAKHKEG